MSRPLEIQEVQTPTISRQPAHEFVKVVKPVSRAP